MATSTITAEFRIDDKKATKRLCDALEAKDNKVSPSNCRRVSDKAEIDRIIKK